MGRPAGMLRRDVQPRNAESARRVAAHTGAIAAPRRWKREGRGNRRLMPELGEGDGSIIVAAPVETAQRPMFRWLGTRSADKRQVIYDGGHFVPRAQLIKETLDWLDRYLGPLQ